MFNPCQENFDLFFERWARKFSLVRFCTPSLNPNGYIVIYTLVMSESNQPLSSGVLLQTLGLGLSP